MRVLVLGGGSAGRRHARNLRSLGVGHISLVEPNDRPVEPLFDVVYRRLDEAPLADFDLVVVATPSILHVEQALAARRAGCHVFVEKPLAVTASQGVPLLALATDRVLGTACNMRFHPAVQFIEETVRGGTLGAPLAYSFHAASWLPHWKPATDYRAGYSARRELGGGALLDCVHEIDLAQWLFGLPDQVSAYTGDGALEGADVEDRAVLGLRHGRVVGQLFLSFSTFGYHRRQLIACERGSIWWDIREGTVAITEPDGQHVRGMRTSPVLDFNQVYLAELRRLLAACRGDEAPVNLAAEALGTIAIVDAAKQAAALGVAQPVIRPTPPATGVSLRPLAEGDLARTLAWMQDPAIFGPFLRREAVTPEQHQRWFASARADESQALFAIEIAGRHVGNCGLKGIDRTNRKAELWLYVGVGGGRGAGTEATRLLVEHAFGALDLRRVWLQVASENLAAQRVYQKAGFQVEGLARDDMWIGDKPITLLRMARLRP